MKRALNTLAPAQAIQQAWLNLATDALLMAIHEARQAKDKAKREKAKTWLLSPAATLFFETVLNTDLDVPSWVSAGCPQLHKNERRSNHSPLELRGGLAQEASIAARNNRPYRG